MVTANSAVRIGIDLDNTIVCYDEVFGALARCRGIIGSDNRSGRIALRDELRAGGREDVWTELQGEAYGDRMDAAPPFAGAREFVEECARHDVAVFVVSHRTRQPYRGPASDLHAAARHWLVEQGFVGSAALTPDRVFLELTRDDKMRRIRTLRCTHFVDDLPELLTDPAFPKMTIPILFDPHDAHGPTALRRLHSWAEAMHIILGESARR